MEFPINKFAVYEPRLELNNQRSFVIVKGGQTVTYQQYPATAYSTSSFNFITNPPGRKNVLDRVAIIEVDVNLAFSGPGDGSGTLMIQSGRDAFRAYPISSITQTLTCQINGFPVTIELSDVAHLLSRFHTNMENKNSYLSIFPQMEDNYQNYADADNANNNPLAPYHTNSTQQPRGAYPMVITNNTNTSANVRATLREYITLPPFIFDGHEAGGLTNLDTLQFDFTLSTALARIWSRSTANHVPISNGGITVTFPSAPKLFLGWITPRLTQEIPRVMTYPYFQISRYVSSGNDELGPNASNDLQSQVIQFSSIPRKLYIFAKQSNTIINNSVQNQVKYTDTFLKITKININWDNIDGVLSGASPNNLYELSVANGMKMPFVEWNGLSYDCGQNVGSTPVTLGLSAGPVCLELGKDLGLRDNQAEGMLDKINFQVTVSVTNVNQTETLKPDLYVVAVYDGVLEIFDNSARAYIGVINGHDILTVPVNHEVSYNSLEKIYGGDFFSKFKDIAGKVVSGLKQSKAISNILGAVPHPYAQVGSNIARSLGFGEGARAGSARAGGVLMGGCDMCQGRCGCGEGEGEGGVLVGGRLADYSKMKQRLRKMR